MHNGIWAIALAPALLALAACGAGEETGAMTELGDHAAQTEETRQVGVNFLTRAFIENEFRDAYNRYGDRDLIQHNPLIADGLAGHEAHFDKVKATEADGDSAQWAHVTDMVLADGDLLAVVHHVFRTADDNGRIVVDLFRVADGKLAEHWDVIQAMPASMPHDNGMGCGTANDHASAVAHEDSIASPTCGRPDPNANREASIQTYRDYVAEVAKGDVVGAIERWFHPDYKQHSPIIPDGKQGAIDYLLAEWGDPDAPLPELGPQRIVAEGDLVLVHYMYKLEGQPDEAHVDIFRITDGLISEHWDFKQRVPETSANANGMW